MIDPSEIFTGLFVTLGPLKTLGPFAQRTRDASPTGVRTIAFWTFLVATTGSVTGGLIGRALLTKWHVSLAALMLTGGIIFFIVALRQLLEQYEPPRTSGSAEALPASPLAAACRLVFPIVLTPYGVAAVIALLAASENTERTLVILGLLVFVMCLDLLAMIFARFILRGLTIIVLQVFGSVLAVLQVAMSVQFMLLGLRSLGVISH
jgi:multiple antibiotic resistance protein